jgi:multidrug resistance protein, MATE family
MFENGVFRKELWLTFKLAVPIMIGEVGQMLMSLTDTMMVGHLDVDSLAGIALSNALLHIALVFGIGVVTSVAVLTSQAHGAGLRETEVSILRAALWMSVGLGVVLALLLAGSNSVMGLLGQPQLVVDVARPYLTLVGWSLIPALGYMATKMFCDSLGKPVVPMCILYGAVILNLILNYILVFGYFGAPRMGLEGSAWATLSSRLLSMLGTLGYAVFLVRGRIADLNPFKIDKAILGSLVKLGIPVGFQLFSEVVAFNLSAIMMGWMGAQALAAHQIAIQCAATTFMFPLGLAQAVTVRIGHSLGKGKKHLIRIIGFGGIGIAACVMTGFALILGFFGHWIAAGFTGDIEVIEIAALLLVVAGAFQLVDGIQVTAMGALRGIADVRIPMLLAYLFYWVVALPVGYMCGFRLGMGPVGIWIGLAVGLLVAATVNATRFGLLTGQKRVLQSVWREQM